MAAPTLTAAPAAAAAAAAAAASVSEMVTDLPTPRAPLDLQVSWLAPRVSNTPPSERRGHTAVNLDNQWILMFGGGGSAGLCNDLYALKIDIETPSWVRVDDAQGIKPPALTGHSAVIAFHRSPASPAEMFIFGGKNSSGESNAVLCFDVVPKVWRAVPTNGPLPPPRYGHTAVIVGTQMVVLGGRAGASLFFDDVWVLDLQTMTWAQRVPRGVGPCARYAHSCVASADGSRLFVFGGSNGNETFNDLYLLDTQKWTWEEKYVTGLVPDARAYHVSAMIDNRFMLVHGGSNGANCFSDIVVLDCASFRWSRLTPSGGLRYNTFQHSACLAGNKLYVFGGHTGTAMTAELRLLNVTYGSNAMHAQLQSSASIRATGSVDDMLARFKTLIGEKPGKRMLVEAREMMWLCDSVKAMFLQEGALVDIALPAQLFGDIHGQFFDLLKLLELFGWPDGARNFVFLGDYVDRGKQSLETLTLLFALKIRFGKSVILLRGNHEDEKINCMHGFLDECLAVYNYEVWRAINEAFRAMPLAAVVGGRIFCVHGGLSPNLKDLSQIRSLHKPADVPSNTLLEDLLWSDPAEDAAQTGFVARSRGLKRGCSYDFGPDAVRRFLDANRLDMMVRAHEVVQDGFELYADGRLVTLFSAPNYCGEYDNAAAVMVVNADYTIDFKGSFTGVSSFQHASPHAAAEADRRAISPPRGSFRALAASMEFEPTRR